MLKKYRCLRCGKSWFPRKVKPHWCPRCKSPYWNRPRRRRSAK